MVIDFRPHFYFRREGPGILFGMTDLSEPPSFNTHVWFVMAAGFSGHGFMLSPAIGECLAELITAGRCRTVDLSPLAIDRFLSGTLRREANVI